MTLKAIGEAFGLSGTAVTSILRLREVRQSEAKKVD
jgi:hypothetical protein